MDNEIARLKKYYSSRAEEYEDIYFRVDPQRQNEQDVLTHLLRENLKDRRVLEVACGTGYWTARIFDSVEYILATDISNEMLDVAKRKAMPPDKVGFQQANAYMLKEVKGVFNAGCAIFWLSHIPKSKMNDFIKGFHKRIGKGSPVVMADNMLIDGIGGKLIRETSERDTFKLRYLSTGERYEIIKNYYTKEDLESVLAAFARNLKIYIGRYFWRVTYSVK
jgi:SAM-dependent methyltransferase